MCLPQPLCVRAPPHPERLRLARDATGSTASPESLPARPPAGVREQPPGTRVPAREAPAPSRDGFCSVSLSTPSGPALAAWCPGGTARAVCPPPVPTQSGPDARPAFQGIGEVKCGGMAPVGISLPVSFLGRGGKNPFHPHWGRWAGVTHGFQELGDARMADSARCGHLPPSPVTATAADARSPNCADSQDAPGRSPQTHCGPSRVTEKQPHSAPE